MAANMSVVGQNPMDSVESITGGDDVSGYVLGSASFARLDRLVFEKSEMLVLGCSCSRPVDRCDARGDVAQMAPYLHAF